MKYILILTFLLSSCIQADRKIANFSSLSISEKKLLTIIDLTVDEFLDNEYEIDANSSSENLVINIYYKQEDHENLNIDSGIRKRNLRILANEIVLAQRDKEEQYKHVQLNFLKVN